MAGSATFVLMLAVTLAVYARALHAPFVFDDRPAIVENPSIRRLVPPIGDATLRGPLNPPPLAPTARRPFSNLSLALDYHWWGLDPAGFRRTALVLHALTATVLALLVRGTVLLPYFGGAFAGAADVLGIAVALVWLVHPLGSETVVYLTQRTELIAALAYLATLWCALRHWTAPTPARATTWGVAAVAACIAGMASKEIVASLPVAVWLYERTFVGGARRATRLYAGLALGWVVLFALNVGGASGFSDAKHDVSPLVWWMTQAKVLFLYLKLVVWPWPLTIHYAPAYLGSAAAWPWLLACAALAAGTAALVRRRPAARFAVVAIALVLAPTMLVPIVKMMAAERRMYLPLAGLVTLAVVGGCAVLARGGRRLRPGPVLAAATALALVLAVVTVRRLVAYESAVTLWADAVHTQPTDAMAHYNLGVALFEAGRPDAQSMARFEEALRLDPGHAGALDNLGLVLFRQRRYDDARGLFERALAADPENAVAANNLGALELELLRPAAALAPLERALASEPDLPKAVVHRNLGKALVGVGRADDGLAHLERAVRLDPADAEAHNGRGAALMALGRAADAVPSFAAALRLAPDDAGIENNLATALLQSGHVDEAVGHLERVLARAPANLGARNNYGTALRTLGRTADAITQFTGVLARDSAHATAHYNLGSALLDSGRPGEAIEHLEEARRLGLDDPQVRFRTAIAYVHAGRRRDGVATARGALADARARGATVLGDDIERWLSAYQ
ncbi:MAG: tetratricopeptide repeat protein [Deltaproteobacteria bacterium]|nr:tetratricopeptide repeat protein [Deltaproteobacteria bacterium]